MVQPNRAFVALLGFASGAVALLGATALRFLRAGLPPGAGWRYAVLPGTGDLAVHLISYTLLGLVATGLLRGGWALVRPWPRLHRGLDRCRAAGGGGDDQLARLGARVGLAGRVRLVDAPVPLAFCAGLVRPRVYVTTGLLAALTERELEAVLWHEEYHVAHRDPLKLVIADALAAVFFLPLLPYLRQRYALAKELAADRRAVGAMGEGRSLAAALYRLLVLAAPHPPPGAPAVGAPPSLAVRIDALLGDDIAPSFAIPRSRLAWTAVGIAALALLLITPLTLFTSPPPLAHGPLAVAVVCMVARCR